MPLVVPYIETRPRTTLTLPPQTDFSEAGSWEYSLRVRAAQTTPPTVPRHPLGTWRWYTASFGGERYSVLDVVAIADLVLTECRLDDDDTALGYRGKLLGIEKYGAWLAAGSEPPPVEGYRLTHGGFALLDGHHRVLALHRAGRTTVAIWLSVEPEAVPATVRAQVEGLLSPV